MSNTGTPAPEVAVLSVLNGALRRRRLLLLLPLAVVSVVLLVSLILPRTYTASAAFTPESNGSQLSALAGVAAEFGVNLPTNGDQAESPQFYADLIESQAFLERLVHEPYVLPSDSAKVLVLMDTVLDVSGATPEAVRARTAQKLGRLITATVSAATGVVRVTVSLRSAGLAHAVIDRTLAQIESFNVTARQSRARGERQFIEDRLKQAAAELSDAEDGLGAFMVRNRDFSKSPQLQFESDRLQRVVSLRQDVLTTLARSLEQAKIDEVRSSSVLTVVEPSSVSPLPDARRLALKMLLALGAGFAIALVIVVGEQYYRAAARSDEAGARELSALAGEARADLNSWPAKIWRSWQGWRRRGPPVV